MPKIVSIVSYPFLPAKVGGQKNISLFYKYLSRLLPLICITTTNNSVDAAEGYQVLNILSSSRTRYLNPFYISKIKKVLVESKATHLMIEHPYYGWLAYFLKRSLPIQLIVHSHNIEGLRWKSLGKWWWKLLWRYERFTHQMADYNFFITDNDMQYAEKEFSLEPGRSMLVTYGTERNAAPPAEDVERAKKMLQSKHGITDETILLFNGAFDYLPNLEALNTILNNIHPLLEVQKFNYKLILCGRNIPAEISAQQYNNVIIAGFVDDIDPYFQSADVFLNPLLEGGGIKTKLVEALASNCNAVSTVSGAIGVDANLCNGKLLIVPDGDWKLFAAKIIEAAQIDKEIGSSYFAHFYWGYNTARASRFIAGKSPHAEAFKE